MNEHCCAVCGVSDAPAVIYFPDGKPSPYKVCLYCSTRNTFTYRTCGYCEKLVLINGMKTFEGKPCCRNCILSRTEMCMFCSKLREKSKMVDYTDDVVTANVRMCSLCLETLKAKCDVCSHTFLMNTSGRCFPDGSKLCSKDAELYFWCSDCERLLPKEVRFSENLCYECTANWANCFYCGDFQRKADCSYVEESEDADEHWVCGRNVCQRKLHGIGLAKPEHFEAGTVFSWDADILTLLGHSPDPMKLLFGYEMEIIVKNVKHPSEDPTRAKVARDFYQAVNIPPKKNTIICKFDGSIRTDQWDHGQAGFEVVSIPMDMPSLKNHLETVLKTAGNRVFVNSTCGMHVHISRGREKGAKGVKPMQITKMLRFLYHDANRRFVNFIAGRTAEEYSSLNARHWKDVGVFMGGLDKGDHHGTNGKVPPSAYNISVVSASKMKGTEPWKNGGRYQALNLINHNTVELRIFAGTTDPNRALANLDFVQAFVDWCSRMVPVMEVVDVNAFVNFVIGNKKAYPHLVKFFENNKDALMKTLEPYVSNPKKKQPTNEVVQAIHINPGQLLAYQPSNLIASWDIISPQAVPVPTDEEDDVHILEFDSVDF